MLSLTTSVAVPWTAVSVALAVGMVLAGCDGTQDMSGSAGPTVTAAAPGAATAGPPPELTAELVASRRDEARDQVRVLLTNASDDSIMLEDVRLVAPPYAAASARISGGVLEAGRTVAYPVDYGDPDCAGPNPTTGPVTVEVDTGGHRVTVDPGESARLIDRMLALHCGRQQVDDLVTIALDTDWELGPGGDEQTGVLVITRRQDGPTLNLAAVRGGINYTLALVDPTTQPMLEAGQQALSVPVVTRGARCDGHAVGDNSKPYTFTAWISVDGGPEIPVEFDARDQPANFDRLCEEAS